MTNPLLSFMKPMAQKGSHDWPHYPHHTPQKTPEFLTSSQWNPAFSCGHNSNILT
jgi:hypothetical protein